MSERFSSRRRKDFARRYRCLHRARSLRARIYQPSSAVSRRSMRRARRTYLPDSGKRRAFGAESCHRCFVTPGDASRVPKATFALVMEEPIAASPLALQRMFPQAIRPKSLLGTTGLNRVPQSIRSTA